MHGETESESEYAERMTRGYRCHEGIEVVERDMERETSSNAKQGQSACADSFYAVSRTARGSG